MRRSALTLLAFIAACAPPQPEIDDSAAAPALWVVENADGETEAYLFGTIHALPAGVKWQTAALAQALKQSGPLVVEIDELDNDGELASIFTALATSQGQPPVTARVPASSRKKAAAALKLAGYKDRDFSTVETWAVALTLAQAASFGDPANGVDRALLRTGKKVLVLEGAQQQLSIFDRLPEAEQRDLLTAVVADADNDQRKDYEALVTMWLTGDMDTLAHENRQGMLADPELREALLVQRNVDWIGKLTGWMPRNAPLFVAVGAAHLAGEDGLPALLADEGYSVRRIQ